MWDSTCPKGVATLRSEQGQTVDWNFCDELDRALCLAQPPKPGFERHFLQQKQTECDTLGIGSAANRGGCFYACQADKTHARNASFLSALSHSTVRWRTPTVLRKAREFMPPIA